MKMNKKRFTSTDIDNFTTERFLFNRFRLMATTQFKWSGLPETIQERHIESVLFEEGRVLFFKHKTDGLLCLPCYDGIGINVYGDPTSYNATGFAQTYRNIPLSECVLIENNMLRMPTINAVDYFVNQLYEVIRTRDVNIRTLKAPFIVTCDDKQLLTFKKVMEEISANNYAIFGDKSFGLSDAIKVFQTGVKPLTVELTDTYHDILNEALTYLGINNANTDKRERLITSEAESNNQMIDTSANMFLEARQRACEEINKKFGLNVSVELRTPRVEGGAENDLPDDKKNDPERDSGK